MMSKVYLLYFYLILMILCFVKEVRFVRAATWIDVHSRISLAHTSRTKRSLSQTPKEIVGISNGEDLMPIDSSRTNEGTNITRFRETYLGIPVYGTYASFETDQVTGLLTGQATGRVLGKISHDIPTTTPRYDNETAFQIALSYLNLSSNSVRQISAKKIRLIIYHDRNSASLVYDVSFSCTINESLVEPGFIIDAITKKVVKFENRLKSALYKYTSFGGNEKVEYMYDGRTLPDLHVDRKGDTCRLRSSNVKIYNMETLTDLSLPGKPFTYNCNAVIEDGVNGAYSQLSDAFFFSEKTFQMYKEWANIGIVNKAPIKVYVHYGKNKIQASFNGESVIFGDGDRTRFYPMVSADTMAHELSHAFTDDHSAMEYEGQSGGIVESFSDITGEALEFFIFGKTDLHSGAEITIKNGKGVRDLCNQSIDNVSIQNVKNYREDMNVHYSSGVFNRIACLMFKSPKIGIKSTFQIFVHANRFYWHETSNFETGSCGLLKATYDLGNDVVVVENALKDVGINPCDLKRYIRTLYDDIEIDGLSLSNDKEIVFRLDLHFTKKSIVRIKTKGAIGDVDMYIGTVFPVTVKNAAKASTTIGNKEKLKLRVNKWRQSECFIMLRPKNESFDGVSLDIKLS